MEFVPAVAMLALVLKVVDFFRYAKNADINGVITQLSAWVAGVVVLLLVAQTAWADGIEVGDRSLSTLGFWSLVFVGLTAGSGASYANDIRKSFDNHDSSALPTLLPSGPKRTRRTKSG